MSTPRVITEALGGSALTAAALEGRTPSHWYLERPKAAEAWREHVGGVRRLFASSDWLRPLLPALTPSGAARERIERVARGGGVVITTGQQAGLFGGPIYTWSKALSALALADALEASTGIPAAPVFWAATDDADFAEAGVTHVATTGGVETLALQTPRKAGVSMRDTPLGDVTRLLLALERGAGGAVYPTVLESVGRIYEPDATIGGAYVSLLRTLLEPLGISVLDAGHPAVGEAARPLLVRALLQAKAIAVALESRQREIRSHGFHPQVPLVDGLSLVFSSDSGSRIRVPIGLASEVAASGKGALGSSVLLRPLIERALLPTASYVAGPAEIAYFAQVGPIADVLELETPVTLPRWSGTIIEPHIARLLERYGLDRTALSDPHAAEARIARGALPSAIAEALTRAKERLSSSLDALRDALRSAGAPLGLPPSVADGFQRDLAHRIARLERRVIAAVKRSEHDAMRDVATMRAALYPLGKRQERVLNLIPILARHGPPLLDGMLDRAREHAAGLVLMTREASASHRATGEISARPS